MSARELNQAKQHLYNSLMDFTQRWRWTGTDISCPLCDGLQSVTEAGAPFRHFPHCANRGDFAQHPWEQLRNALERLPVLMASPPAEKSQCDLPGAAEKSHCDLSPAGGSTVDPGARP